MATGQCCTGGRRTRRLARLTGAGSVLPGAALLLLPKCPLCVALWLTAATGIGISAAAVVWLQWSSGVFAIVALGLILWQESRRRLRQRDHLTPVDAR